MYHRHKAFVQDVVTYLKHHRPVLECIGDSATFKYEEDQVLWEKAMELVEDEKSITMIRSPIAPPQEEYEVCKDEAFEEELEEMLDIEEQHLPQ